MNSLLGITVDPTMVYDPTGKEWRDKCKELEAQVRVLKVGEALHKVCIQQRNTEIKRVDKAEAQLDAIAEWLLLQYTKNEGGTVSYETALFNLKDDCMAQRKAILKEKS